MFKALKRSSKGAAVPHEKATAGMATVQMPTPAKVVIPMSMHIGAPAEPVVAKGDTVMVGTLIGKAKEKALSANIYSSVSGTVESVGPFRMPNGPMTTAVTIKTDGEQKVDPSCKPPVVTDKASLLDAVKNCGLVGLGGAGFPTHVKLAAKVDTLLINAAECEPFLTTDTREMLECSDTILSGVAAVMKYCEIPTCIIGIEANKPECIDLLNTMVKDMQGVSVKSLPMRYPQGAEKTLVETCTGREVPQLSPSGRGAGLPADAGCIIMNVTSVSTLGKFLKDGVPLHTKRVTVEGDAIAEPQNIEVPIGALYSDIVAACGGIKEGVELGKVIFGGPMMGGAVGSLDYPVLKQNNGLLLFSKKAAVMPDPSPCIRCGRCISACPMGLEPVVIVEEFNGARDFAKLKARCVDLCVACGSCTYACPAKRLVSQNMGLAKAWYMSEVRKGGK